MALIQIESCQFQGYAPSQGGALELRILADRAAPSALPGPVAQGVVANVPVTIVGGHVLNVPVVTVTSLLDATAALDRGLRYSAQIWQGGVFREYLRGLESFLLVLPAGNASWLEIYDDQARLFRGRNGLLFTGSDLADETPSIVNSAVTVLGARTTSESNTNVYVRCYDEEIGPYLRYNAADDRWETAGLNGVPQALGGDALGPVSASDTVLFERVAAGPLSGHRAVRAVDATHIAYCDAATPGQHNTYLGITLGAANMGDIVQVKREGFLTEASWNWMPGEMVCVAVNGTLTQIAPIAPASVFALAVGVALTPTTVFLSPGTAIILG